MSPSGEKVCWYVLFANTGSEDRLVELLNKNLDSKIIRSFVPKAEHVFRRKGIKSRFKKICFPGYVFIESALPLEIFLACTFPVIYKLKDAYKFLNYGKKTDIAMRDEERISLSNFLGDDKLVEISIGYREGDSVKVISGPLVGNEGTILRVKRNRNEADIMVKMFCDMVPATVGFELIEKKVNYNCV